jgi:hypothetical protein
MEKHVRGTPLLAKGEWDSDWTVSTSLPELKRLLGMPLLVQFCRCSVAADRLTSLGDFGLFNEEWKPRLEVAHSRNLQTMFWFTWGTLHEAIDALTEMELLGVEGLLGSFEARKPWLELRSFANRWKADPVYQRVRNKIAFHLDSAAIRKGINKPGRDVDPVVWKQGNSRKGRSTTFTFAQDCLASLLFPEELTEERAQKRFGELAQKVRDVHLGFSPWIEELFIAAVRGAALGLKPTPRERPRSGHLAQQRLDGIAELADQAPEILKAALGDLLDEVRRLGGLVKRSESDPGAAVAQRRRSEEEQRLRAIAATARQYLESGAPAAEKRLRELLEMQQEG